MENYKKLLGVVILGIIIVVGLVVYRSNVTKGSDPQETPKISITADGVELSHMVGKNIWNGSIYDRLDNLQFLMGELTEEGLTYVPLGAEIQIQIEGAMPNSVELVDEVIDVSGNVIYSNTSKEIPIKLHKGIGSFILEEHMATSLSSSTKTFEEGVIRGYRLTCKWSDNECEYGFIIKTEQ